MRRSEAAVKVLVALIVLALATPIVGRGARADEKGKETEGEKGKDAGKGKKGKAEEEENETGPNFAVPADLAPEAKKDYERALESYERAKTSRRGQTGNIAGAIRDFKKAGAAAPKLAPVHYYLGVLYQWTKEFEKARAALVKACELNPGFHQAVVELGDVHMWQKQPKKGLAEYDRAIAMKPDYAHAYTMRGLARIRAGDFEGAQGDLELARKKRPSDEMIPRLLEIAKREVDGPGWPTIFTCETEHYRILTPVSQALADDLGKHAELIFKTYSKIFPKVTKEKRKFPVIVHADKAGYRAGGGPESAGGHYDPLIRKLVLFRYPEDADTKLVLYHEGFHQFLHDYLEKAPQWFNEGLGDFFGPSQYVEPVKKGQSGGMRLRPNPWRLELIQVCIQRGKIRAWRELMLMSQEELYEDEWAGIHYAEAWSIIYFLIRGGAKADENSGPYFKLLQDYFSALRRGDGQETAFEASFGRVDLGRIEGEWKQFILGLGRE